jgi:murein DD-endopeptidase MepM/ murein hydrolase activator NlpD
VKLFLAATLAALLLALPASASASTPRWNWPLADARVISRPYLAAATPYGAGHRGVDLEAGSSIVFAPADGVVHFAGVVVDRPVMSISHEGGILSSYEPVTTTLVAGDIVHRGDIIGELQPGHCQVVLCLHFGVRIGGEYVSPMLFLGGVPRAVLLPTRRYALP